MQQWLNEPKNQPIVYAVAGLFTIGAIVLILFQVGVIGGPAPYVPPAADITGAPAPPTAAGATAAVPRATPSASNPVPVGPVNVPTVGTAASVPAKPASLVVNLASAPNARVDPFAPYGGVRAFYVVPKPRVDTFAPPLTITNYTLPRAQIASTATNGFGNGQSINDEPTFAGRLNGVMLGNGAYALVDSGGQSLVLQPGDQIPGGGQLISIQSDSISVKYNGQVLKVPISPGSDNGTAPASAPAPTGVQSTPPGGNNPTNGGRRLHAG